MKDRQDTGQKPDSDQSSLSALYPNPKTYEQRQNDRQEVAARHLGQKPHHIIISTSLRLFGVLVAMLVILNIIPKLLLWNVLSGVSLSFLLGLAVLGILYGTSQRIQTDFEQLNLSAGPLFIAYTMSIIPLLAACAALNNSLGANALPGPLFYAAMTVIHFITASILIGTIASMTLSDGQKLIVLSSTVAFSLLAGAVSIAIQ